MRIQGLFNIFLIIFVSVTRFGGSKIQNYSPKNEKFLVKKLHGMMVRPWVVRHFKL